MNNPAVIEEDELDTARDAAFPIKPGNHPAPAGDKPLTAAMGKMLLARLDKLEAENRKLKAKAKKAPRRARPVAAPAVEKQEPVPPEFEGLSSESCCDACVANAGKAAQAQRRMNEIGMAFKRIPSPNRESPTVMESDAEYLARNPGIDRQEWADLCSAIVGCCVIQGGPGCAHPRKGGLSPTKKADPLAVQRFNRAARFLKLENLKW